MSPVHFDRHKNELILHTDGIICDTHREILESQVFERVLTLYIETLRRRDSPILDSLPMLLGGAEEQACFLELLRSLTVNPLEQALKITPILEDTPEKRKGLLQFIEGLYDFWRKFHRFVICHSENGPNAHDQRPFRTFNATVEQLTHLVRGVYRDVCENITGDHPRIYRQIRSGCNMGIIAVAKDWNPPRPYGEPLRDIPFIRQVLVYPPLILDPPMNTRTGQFRKVTENPLEGITWEKEKWLCYPAQVGPLVIFVYFHQCFISLGCCLANLFELATDEQIAAGPDAIYAYGAPPEVMAKYGELPTVFYEDSRNDLLVAAIPGEDRFGYFGYLKKMILTLHNIRMMQRGRMPFHGAMTRITLKRNIAANIVLMGDTATGKSETLEAFRSLGAEYIRDMRVIADDMGSFEVTRDGKVAAYGTEIGAFVRLDDLQQGYAFDQIDRAIIMSPQKVNARVVLPVTSLAEVLHGYPANYIFYANNYEELDEEHHIIDRFETPEAALRVFREGAAMGKGTTTSKGLVHSYFANIFGPPQYRDLHDRLAQSTFEAAFQAGVFVGQIRTRLGVPGCETTGPLEAARALLALMSEPNQR